MANGTEIRALELGEQIAQKQNVYIVDVTYKKADDTYSLCYYIDKEGGKVSSITNMINHVMEYPEDLKG